MRFSFSTALVASLSLATLSSVAAITCPAGQSVNAGGCQLCPVGTFNPAPVTSTSDTQCTDCPAGQFGGVQGAKACCDCCTGYFSDAGAASCTACTTTSGDCPSGPPTGPGSGSCALGPGNTCPATTPGGPQGSPVTRKRDLGCARGFKKCPHYPSSGGFECIDVAKDPENCGGCVFVPGIGIAGERGRDCTAIPGIRVARCRRGDCVIDSCRKGFRKNADGKACLPNKFVVQTDRKL